MTQAQSASCEAIRADHPREETVPLTRWRAIRAVLISFSLGAVTVLAPIVSSVPASAGASQSILTQKNLIDGSEIGVWETDGGPALTNSTVTSDITATKTPVVRWGAYDCFSDETCGTDSHTGTLSRSTFETTISGITGTLHAVPWLKLVPVTKGAIGSVSNGSVFCPPSTNWGMNLAMDKSELDAVAAVYKGPIILESSNEAEYDCYSAWGFAGAGAVGVSSDIGHMYAATMPALKSYAQSLGFSQVVSVGYIGVNGGTGWGQTCTVNSGSPFGYNCTTPTRWIDEFNNAVKGDGAAAPDVESVHSYCHSTDFSTNPYTFDNNECYAFQRENLTNFRSQVDSIWGATAGDQIRFAVSEWQAGTCTNFTSNCWSGWTGSGNQPGGYDDGYLSMLAGNGTTTGTGTAYWAANLFEWASNGTCCSTAPSEYNIANADGTTPAWYANIKTDFLATQAANYCSISEDSSTPAIVDTATFGTSATTASFSPPAGSLLEVVVNSLQSAPGGVTVSLSDSKSDAFTAGPHDEAALTDEGVWTFQHYYTSAPGSLTVTASESGANAGTLQLAVRVLDNAAQVQAGAATATFDSAAGGATTNQYTSLTTTTKNSLVYGGVANGNALDKTMSPLTTTSSKQVEYDAISGDTGAVLSSSSATGTPGAANYGYTKSTPDKFVTALQEVLPAAC